METIQLQRLNINTVVWLAANNKEPASVRTLNTLLSRVCTICSVSIADVLSAKRQRQFVIARHLFFFLAKQNYPHTSYQSLGEMIGNRDHTTVLHAMTSIRNLIDTNDPTFMKFYNAYNN